MAHLGRQGQRLRRLLFGVNPPRNGPPATMALTVQGLRPVGHP
jgi:hypothetical protein